MNFLADTFVIFAGLALGHFIYESIIAPDLRLRQWVKLLALSQSNSIRFRKRIRATNSPEETYREVRKSHRTQLDHQYAYTFSLLMPRAKRSYEDNDSAIQGERPERHEILESLPAPEFNEIRTDVADPNASRSDPAQINSGALRLCVARHSHFSHRRYFAAAPKLREMTRVLATVGRKDLDGILASSVFAARV